MERFERPERKEDRRPRDPGKISPGLRDQMQRAERNASFAVVLTFAQDDGVRIPLLPDLDEEEAQRGAGHKARAGDRRPGREARAQSARAAREAAARRRARRCSSISGSPTAWHSSFPSAEITRLARDEQVAYLQPVQRRRGAAAGRRPEQRRDRRPGPHPLGPLLQPEPHQSLDRASRHRGAAHAHDVQQSRPDGVLHGLRERRTRTATRPAIRATTAPISGRTAPRARASSRAMPTAATAFRGATAIRLDSWRIYYLERGSTPRRRCAPSSARWQCSTRCWWASCRRARARPAASPRRRMPPMTRARSSSRPTAISAPMPRPCARPRSLTRCWASAAS